MRIKRAEMVATLVPGACFKNRSGSSGRVESAEMTNVGMKLLVTYATKKMLRKSHCIAHYLITSIEREATAAEFAEARKQSEAAMKQTTVRLNKQLAEWRARQVRNALKQLPGNDLDARVKRLEDLFGRFLVKQLEEAAAAE